ncbi:hypothetical protein QBC43DRAFT_362291 [Cladorrhinum sp. PSN259]|nr:hypothetical protein QBC43DRAFT_362291 [Cladorrhinum sp. PSN259]
MVDRAREESEGKGCQLVKTGPASISMFLPPHTNSSDCSCWPPRSAESRRDSNVTCQSTPGGQEQTDDRPIPLLPCATHTLHAFFDWHAVAKPQLKVRPRLCSTCPSPALSCLQVPAARNPAVGMAAHAVHCRSMIRSPCGETEPAENLEERSPLNALYLGGDSNTLCGWSRAGEALPRAQKPGKSQRLRSRQLASGKACRFPAYLEGNAESRSPAAETNCQPPKQTLAVMRNAKEPKCHESETGESCPPYVAIVAIFPVFYHVI